VNPAVAGLESLYADRHRDGAGTRSPDVSGLRYIERPPMFLSHRGDFIKSGLRRKTYGKYFDGSCLQATKSDYKNREKWLKMTFFCPIRGRPCPGLREGNESSSRIENGIGKSGSAGYPSCL